MPAESRLVLATRNRHKIAELRRILAAAGLDLQLLGMDDFPDAPEVVEDGTSFAENALKKARSAAAATGLAAVADDSGLCVDVLNGMPGVFSARWSGPHGSDASNLALLLDQLSDVPDGRRSAHFACVAALVLPDGQESVAEGRVYGHLITKPCGAGGFGYDPIFVPDGETRTTAELPPGEKDAISHRGHAFRAIAEEIANRLDQAGSARGGT